MRRFFTPGWLLRHLVMVVIVAVCLVLGWWQLGRAQGGNALSIGYAVEWPVFALFTIGIWAREVRLARQADRPAVPRPAAPVDPLRIEVPVPGRADPVAEDDATAAYNRYLAWLGADPTHKPADYPGR